MNNFISFNDSFLLLRKKKQKIYFVAQDYIIFIETNK